MAFLLLLTGCRGGQVSDISEKPVEMVEAAESAKQDGERSYDFIFVCPIVENEYWESCVEGMQRADEELGTSTKVIGPGTANNFTTEIVGYMEQAIEERPDGIMVYAGIEALFPLIEQATGLGIPVLALDSDAPDTSRVAYVGTDAFHSGYKAGETMVELTGGSAKVGLLVSSRSAEKEMQVMDAFADAVADYDIEIVAMEETNADPGVAEEKTRQMLTEHPEINAMFNTAGYNVTGAARAKRAMGREDLVLLGFDDIEENLRYVREGVINAIFVQRIEQVGYQGVRLMKECIDRGSLLMDSYDTGTIKVTKENVDTYNLPELLGEDEGRKVRVGYYTGDIAFQNGFEESARKSGYAYEYYQGLSTLTGWSYEYVYGTRTEIMEQLLAGDVDIVAGVYKTDERKKQMLFSKLDMGLEGEPRYFVVSPGKVELLQELDYAMEELLYSMPEYQASLWQKYYGQASQQQILTENESAWLAERDTLTIGYVRHNLPLCDQDENGEPTGVVLDLTEFLADYLRVEIATLCYENVSLMEEGLLAGEIDMAFPVYSDLWLTESRGFRQTDPIVSDRVMVVYNGSYTSDLMERVVLTQTELGQRYYLESYYPDTEVVFYDSREAVFDAIERGEERCIVGSASILQRFINEHEEYRNMNVAYLDIPKDFCLEVTQENGILAGILNKAILQTGSAKINGSMMHYSSVEKSYTFMDFLRRYSVTVITILCIFFAVLLWVFLAYQRRTRHFNEEQEKSRRALEEALVAAKVASEAKTTFLSSMSHDIRTPMNAIVGMTTIAMKHLGDREKLRDCLDKINVSSHHLLTLINDVLDISKIESGRLTLNPVVFSLRDMLTTLVNIVRPQIVAKDLQFDIHVRGIDYETVLADEVRVNQIFINILSNAVKYTPEGGRVVLGLTEETLADGRTVRLVYTVEDSGIGMSKEFMETMYETFARATDSRINEIQGTGLGLAIVRQMVDMLGGTIDCQSEENKGTKFTVTLELPAGREEQKLMLPAIPVLIVDDDGIFLDSAKEVLADLGTLPETAESGEAAVALVQAKREEGGDYPVVIVDWKMPGMDGLQTVREIRRIMGSRVSIILVSAYDWTDIESEAEGSGADGFISKPLFRSYIYEKLQEMLQPKDQETVIAETGGDDLTGRRLLIAEDNDLNWEIISELLTMQGITADWAPNGQLCVDMLTAAPPGTYDLILMDVQMPVMNGREATRMIREDSREYIRNIPIIAMTADAFAEDIAESLACGMNGHVSKPVDMNILCQEMLKALGFRS
ncbi:MAG: response regulator [Muribaculaceae bacterium]|nr:response regulator [Roseburia sp.]MCM1431462.1 response regulator [Muribaculaceae bacterium]MCM1493244.1 response regulator [Muribaculaceae bacterium]